MFLCFLWVLSAVMLCVMKKEVSPYMYLYAVCAYAFVYSMVVFGA